MEDYPLNLLNPARLYQPSFHATSMESSFKLDEGYSEEVRSQDGSESSMRLGSRTGDMLEGANPVVAELANGLLALNEADRSGMEIYTLLFSWPLTKFLRICL